MFDKLAGIGLRGKRAAEHDEDEDAKANEHEDDKDAKAEDDEEDEDVKARAAEDDEDEDEEEAKVAKAAASRRQAAKASAAKFQAKAKAITDLCKLAGRAELAGEYIASGASQASVREHLLGLRADERGAGEISGQTGPTGGSVRGAWDRSIARVQGRHSHKQTA